MAGLRAAIGTELPGAFHVFSLATAFMTAGLMTFGVVYQLTQAGGNPDVMYATTDHQGHGFAIAIGDGTPTLRFLDPKTFAVIGRLDVRDGGRPVAELNELNVRVRWMGRPFDAPDARTPKYVQKAIQRAEADTASEMPDTCRMRHCCSTAAGPFAEASNNHASAMRLAAEPLVMGRV